MSDYVRSRHCPGCLLSDLLSDSEPDTGEQMDSDGGGADILADSSGAVFAIFVLLCPGEAERPYNWRIWSRGFVVDEIFLWYNRSG